MTEEEVLDELYPVISDTPLGRELLKQMPDDTLDKDDPDDWCAIWVARSNLGNTFASTNSGGVWWEIVDIDFEAFRL